MAREAGHATIYPLAGVVAEAIIDSLKKGRPKTEDRHLFFRARAAAGSDYSRGCVIQCCALSLQGGQFTKQSSVTSSLGSRLVVHQRWSSFGIDGI
jgi:hypothetical protein